MFVYNGHILKFVMVALTNQWRLTATMENSSLTLSEGKWWRWGILWNTFSIHPSNITATSAIQLDASMCWHWSQVVTSMAMSAICQPWGRLVDWWTGWKGGLLNFRTFQNHPDHSRIDSGPNPWVQQSHPITWVGCFVANGQGLCHLQPLDDCYFPFGIDMIVLSVCFIF